jgi:MoaA/NifB/PqqE/SkfB family radical SAM enzyme
MQRFTNVLVEMTTRCNLRCRHCLDGDPARATGRQDIDLTLVRRVVAQLQPGTEVLLHGFGEPTLHPGLLDAVREVGRLGLRPLFTSNASLRTPEFYDRAFEAGLARLDVSVDTLDPARATELRPGTNLSRLRENLVHLSRHHADRFRVRSVISSANADEYGATLDGLHGLGVRSLALQPFEFWGTGPDWRLDDARRDAFRAQYAARTAELGMRVEWANFAPTGRRCACPAVAPGINVRGFVTPCCHILDERVIAFGSLESSTLEEVFASDTYRAFMTAFASGYPAICDPCLLRKNDLDGRAAAPAA